MRRGLKHPQTRAADADEAFRQPKVTKALGKQWNQTTDPHGSGAEDDASSRLHGGKNYTEHTRTTHHPADLVGA